VKASLTRLFYLSSLIIALAIGYHLAARDVAILRAEVEQMKRERQEIFERWRDIERTYREWYEGEYGQLE
jgi:cell division protein FtsB